MAFVFARVCLKKPVALIPLRNLPLKEYFYPKTRETQGNK